MTDLSTEVAGLKFKNPLILASGILGETGGTLARVIHRGAAAVVTKSIGLHPRAGHDNPTIVELDYGLINAMGLPNPGIHDYKNELSNVLTSGVPVIGSVFGSNEDEFLEVAQIMADFGVSGIELNLSCPHAKGYGAEIGSDPEMVKNITAIVKKNVSKPIFVKLTPNTSDIVGLGSAACDCGCDGLVAINTIKAMAIEPELSLPILSNKLGGLSGPAIKPIGLRCVYELASANLDIPIIGVGGITTGKDVAEYLMAGATAVQIGTALYYYGMEAFKKILSELEEFLNEHNYNSARDIIGLAVNK